MSVNNSICIKCYNKAYNGPMKIKGTRHSASTILFTDKKITLTFIQIKY